MCTLCVYTDMKLGESNNHTENQHRHDEQDHIVQSIPYPFPRQKFALQNKDKTRLITMVSKPIVLFLFYFSLGSFVGVVWYVWFGRVGLVGCVW